MKVESRIHELNEMVQSEKLGAHAGLVAEEVALLETHQLAALA